MDALLEALQSPSPIEAATVESLTAAALPTPRTSSQLPQFLSSVSPLVSYDDPTMSDEIDPHNPPPTTVLPQQVRTRAFQSIAAAVRLTALGPTFTVTASVVESLLKLVRESTPDASTAQYVFDLLSMLAPAPPSLHLQLSETVRNALDDCSISGLPRSARSSALLCANAILEIVPSDSLTSSVCEALLGEKDPRVLLAALSALSASLSHSPISPSYPHGEVFDAVAPYYPVTFSPPPNSPHRITNKDLRDAVNGVFHGLHNEALTDAINLILDRISPSDSDPNTTPSDVSDAADDLNFILSNRSPSEYASHLTMISTAIVTSSDPPEPLLSLLSSIASACDSKPALFGRFTAPAVRHLLSDVTTTPDSLTGRSATRALSALARSGPKALASAMAAVPPLLSLTAQKSEAAAAAIGVLFAAAPQDVAYSPSPAAAYAEDAVSALAPLADEGSASATLAMASVIASGPEALVPEAIVDTVCRNFLSQLDRIEPAPHALAKVLERGRCSDAILQSLLPLATTNSRGAAICLGRAASSVKVADVSVPYLLDAFAENPIPATASSLARIAASKTDISHHDPQSHLLKSYCAVSPNQDLEALKLSTPHVTSILTSLPSASQAALVALFAPLLTSDDPLSLTRSTLAMPLLAAVSTAPSPHYPAILPALVKRSAAGDVSAADAVRGIIQSGGDDDTAKIVLASIPDGAPPKFLAVVGGASYIRGGASSSIGDAVVKNLASQAETSVQHGDAIGDLLALKGGGAFWRQRAAAIAMPALTPISDSPGALLALCHISCCVPPTVADVTHAVAALKRTMADPEKLLTVTALAALIRSPPPASTLPSLIPSLLHHSSRPKSTVPNILALQVLSNLAQTASIASHVPVVCAGLKPTLDHEKRAVRQAAVAVRNSYLLIN